MRPIYTIRNGWGKFCSIEPLSLNILRRNVLSFRIFIAKHQSWRFVLTRQHLSRQKVVGGLEGLLKRFQRFAANFKLNFFFAQKLFLFPLKEFSFLSPFLFLSKKATIFQPWSKSEKETKSSLPKTPPSPLTRGWIGRLARASGLELRVSGTKEFFGLPLIRVWILKALSYFNVPRMGLFNNRHCPAKDIFCY